MTGDDFSSNDIIIHARRNKIGPVRNRLGNAEDMMCRSRKPDIGRIGPLLKKMADQSIINNV
jgi:hypothetical protein